MLVTYLLGALMGASQPPVVDSLRTSRGGLFVLRGDTLSIDAQATQKSPATKMVFLVRGDSIVQLAPAPTRPLPPAISKALVFAAKELREGRQYRR